MNGHRKLMVLGLNEALKQGAVSLDPSGEESGHLMTNIAGYPSVISWSSIGSGELRFSVWWKYDHANHPQANLNGNQRECFTTSSPLAKSQHYPKFVGVVTSGWIERKTGKFVQGYGAEAMFETYTRRGERKNLDAIPNPRPDGFAIEGQFFT